MEMFALRQLRMHTGDVAVLTHQTRCLLRDCGIDRRLDGDAGCGLVPEHLPRPEPHDRDREVAPEQRPERAREESGG